MAGPAGAGGGALASVLVAGATVLVILGVTVAILITPISTHAALRYAGSAAILGLTPAQTESVSDHTIGELLTGPGSFAFAAVPGGAPFYDEGEASHLRDARTVLYAFSALVLLSGLLLLAVLVRRGRRAWPWRSIAAGAAFLAAALALVGLLVVVAFDPVFELFHRVLFPGGNYSFDPTTERMVQLYPTPFWQLTATVLAVLAIAISLATWYLAGRRARVLANRPQPVSPR